MQIVYIIYWLDEAESGVIKKIAGQASVWSTLEVRTHLLIYTLKGSLLDADRETIKAIFGNEHTIISFSSVLDTLFLSSRIYHSVNNIKPDVVYFRYCKYSVGLIKTIKNYPSVMEVNSLELYEMSPLSMGYIYTWLTRGLVLKKMNGLVTVTDELARHPHYKVYDKPYVVIGNGVAVSAYNPLPFVVNKDSINLVFIGTDNQPWHGIDEILRLAGIKTNWSFHIIGTNGVEYQSGTGKNVTFHGKLKQDEYIRIFEQCDIAIGTMALYRKKMQEACPLKVREYLLHGLPVIIGYQDVDFNNNHSFILRLPNRENSMVDNIDKIDDFVRLWKNRRVSKKDIMHLDSSLKESQRITFLRSISGQTKNFQVPNG